MSTEPASTEPTSTEIVPIESPVVPPAAPTAAPKKKRRGWLIALIVVGIVVVLAIVAFFVADAIAKDYARDYVRDRVVEVLGLPADADVDVDLGGGSIIFQALAGRVDTVDVEVPDATFGQLTGDLQLHAERLPLDQNAAVEVLRIDFAVGADDLAALSAAADPAAAPEFAFVDDEVSISSDFELFGATIPIGLSLVPSAANGALVLTPTQVSVGTQTFEAGDDGGFLGQIVSGLFQPQTLCIANQLPEALVLDQAQIDGASLALTFRGDGAALGGPEFSTLGTCPAT